MSDPGPTGSPTPTGSPAPTGPPDPAGAPTSTPGTPPPGSTRIQEVQGKGRWRPWVLALVLVLALVAVGLLVWAGDRQTANDEADGDEAPAEQTTSVATTEPVTTTGATTSVETTTSAPDTTLPATTSAPTTGPGTTASPDSTLAPTTVPAPEGILADLAGLPEYSTLSSLLAAAGITSLPEPVTLFAPTNEAFEALPAETLEFLTDPANVDVLTQILANHVVSGALLAADLPTGTTLTTLAGDEVEVTSEGGRLLVGGVPVVEADLEGGDGSVIHGIDGVLVPAGVELPG